MSDGSIRGTLELKDSIIKQFSVTEEEKQKKTPNGKQLLLYNRIAWSISYLKMAELITSPERGKYQISQLGKGLLQKNPQKISVSLLKTYPGFIKNRNPEKTENEKESGTNQDIETKTPDELIDIGYSQIRNELSRQILESIQRNSPYFFEQLVIDLLVKMGYGGADSSEVTPNSSDEGIDGIIKEDKLGLDKIYVQAKKWEGSVGRPEIQKFVGALQGKKAKKGIFITTSSFSKEAISYTENLELSVILIDGQKLANLMIDYELGVSVKNTIKICKFDSDYFVEE